MGPLFFLGAALIGLDFWQQWNSTKPAKSQENNLPPDDGTGIASDAKPVPDSNSADPPQPG